VFYIPIYDLNDKFKIQIYDYNAFFKHVFLGSCVLDIKDFIKVLSDGSVKGKKLDLESDLRPNKGKLHFTADFQPISEQDLIITSISKTDITINHLYILMTYQRHDGCFELTDKLAKLFNFNSKEELIKSFTAHVKDDGQVKNLHVDIWGTALITGNLFIIIHYYQLDIFLLTS
jgi:Ca2+-dependent lipid-binding protein